MITNEERAESDFETYWCDLKIRQADLAAGFRPGIRRAFLAGWAAASCAATTDWNRALPSAGEWFTPVLPEGDRR